MRTIVSELRGATWIHYSDGMTFVSSRIAADGSERHWSQTFEDWIDNLEVAFGGASSVLDGSTAAYIVEGM